MEGSLQSPLIPHQSISLDPRGRGGGRPEPDRGYLKLLLARTEGRKDQWLIALKATADFYGWTAAYPIWSPRVLYSVDGREVCSDPGRRGQLYRQRGRLHRICRADSRQGNPAGKTNQFKLSNSCTLATMAELAHHTQGDWRWMTGPNFKPVLRDDWARRYLFAA